MKSFPCGYSLLQKEIALYTASKISSEFCWFDIDGDINPLFKVIPKMICMLRNVLNNAIKPTTFVHMYIYSLL